MKKVLILAYDFPPYVSVGGLRPHSWFKYLSSYYIYPIIITRQWNNNFGNKLDYISPSEHNYVEVENSNVGIIIRTPYFPNFPNKLMLKFGENKFRVLRRVLTAIYEFVQWIIPVGTKHQIYLAADKYLNENKVDCIIATGDPFILFQYASKLSLKFKIPWIADYRDAWTQNKYNSKNILIKKWNSYFEKKCIKSAVCITTVSEFLEIKIKEIIKKKTIYVIPNGFDPENIISKNIIQNSNILNIAYIGTLYKWHPIKSFLRIVSEVLTTNNEIQIKLNFYGINIEQELIEIIQKEFPLLINRVSFFSKMQNAMLFCELEKNDLLLLFNDYSIMGTKIYDYLAIKRHIIICFSNDKSALSLKAKYYSIDEKNGMNSHLQEDLIIETNSGSIIENENHLKEMLMKFYVEFKNNGSISCNTSNIEKFSRIIQTKKLAEIINRIC